MQIQKLPKSEYPFLLRQISQLPDEMDIIGTMPPETYKYLCVVGSRGYTNYGEEVCKKLISGLRGYPIVIVSGLAIGIDSIAHEAALAAGLKTIAFPGSGLDDAVIYPANHYDLAKRIVESGGALLSPFEKDTIGAIWTFPTRNRLMAGISSATLVIEGGEGSGTCLTVKATSEFSRDLLAVPGSIFSELSHVPHQALREGATAITSSEELLLALGFDPDNDEITKSLFASEQFGLSKEEKQILEKLVAPISRDDLMVELKLPASYINAVLVELEIKGLVFEREGLLTLK